MGKTSWLWFSAADTCGRKKLWVEMSVLFVEVVPGSLSRNPAILVVTEVGLSET